jgi:hypothetical protein
MPNQGVVAGHAARGGERVRRIHRASAHYLFFSDEIIGVNGHLTYEAVAASCAIFGTTPNFPFPAIPAEHGRHGRSIGR